MPDEKAMEALSAKDKAFIAGAGPLVNFIWTLIVFGVLGLTLNTSTFAPIAAPLLIVAAGLALSARFSSRYLVLVVGCALLAALIHGAVTVPSEVVSGLGGPVTIVDMTSGFYQSGVSTGDEFRQAFMISGVISILLGTTNALPFFPLDGGHIAKAYLGLWSDTLANSFAVISGFCFFLIIGLALTNDIRLLF